MRFQALTLFFALNVICLVAEADQVVTFITGQSRPSLTARAYLSASPRDEGYVTITARVGNAGDQTCVAPAVNSFLVDRKLEVTVTARMIGFFGVDRTKEVPLATYIWNGSKYCRSAWQLPVLLVPPSPIGVPESQIGNSSADDPEIILGLRASSSDSEQALVFAQAILGVSGGLFTGGAANTVVGLSNFAAGPAAKFLSDRYNSTFKNDTDQTFEIHMKWTDIAKGVQAPEIIMVAKELESHVWTSDETPLDAIQKLKRGQAKGIPILSINLDVNTRRSVFTDDGSLSAQYTPKTSFISKQSVLNYPKAVTTDPNFPTLYQRIHDQAPSLLQDLTTKSENCDRLLVTIRSLGFDAIDRAIITKAMLDDAYPGWEGDTGFHSNCFHLDPDIDKRLETAYSDYHAGPILQPPKPEITTNPIPGWTDPYRNYMSNIRLAFFSTPDARQKVLKSAFAGAPVTADADFLINNPNFATVTSDDFLKGFVPTRVGCIFGYSDNGDIYSAMLLSAKDEKSTAHPYLMLVKQKLEVDQKTVSAQAVWLWSLDKPPGDAWIQTLQGADFGDRSACYRGVGPGRKQWDTVLNSFRVDN